MAITSESNLPPLYATWIDQLLPGPIPDETAATCYQCPMCAAPTERRVTRTFFKPSIKCCTYMPNLPNFLVGRMFDDDNTDALEPTATAGLQTVIRRIAARVGVTPLGLAIPPAYKLLYTSSNKELETATFGQSTALRCPHYLEEQGGLCGVWKHRNSVCSTWFCKHVRGAVGSKFWVKGVKALLDAVERDLARWCLVELNISSEILEMLTSARLETLDAAGIDNTVDWRTYQAMWGQWSGREPEFYRACARLVSPLTWQNVKAICGPEVQMFAKITQDAYARLVGETLPPVLVLNNYQVIEMHEDCSLVMTYSPYDVLEVPHELLNVLRYFDGRPTDEVINAVREQAGIELEAEAIIRLRDFCLLVEVNQ